MELLCTVRPVSFGCPAGPGLADTRKFHHRLCASASRSALLSSSVVISTSSCRSLLLPGLERRRKKRKQGGSVVAGFFPVDPWSPEINSESIASQFFAASLLPYIGFLYHLTRSKTAPKLTLFGFYFLLLFVGATIPAGIYAKVHYGTSLSNVDWLHGGAEFFLTLTNLFIVIGLRQALRAAQSSAQKAEVAEDKLDL